MLPYISRQSYRVSIGVNTKINFKGNNAVLILQKTKNIKMKKVIKWLKESNRYKHLIGGVLVGGGANSLYCAAYAGIGIATALELKDKMWGGKADIIDWGLTVDDVAIGFGVRTLVNLVI